MKIVRGIYVGLVYVMALPLAVVFMAGMMVWAVIMAVRDHCVETFGELCRAMADGVREGHNDNMRFVKEGRVSRH